MKTEFRNYPVKAGRWFASAVALIGGLAGNLAPDAVPMEWADVPALVARIHAPKFAARDFDVTAFGAVGDGRTNSLPGIRAAIAACSAAGGGRVVVPAGVFWLEGPVHLASHVELHLSAGATLRFSGRPADFLPTVLTRWEGTLVQNYSPLIYAHGAEDIAVTGSGVIDGNARAEFARWRPRQDADQQRLRRMGSDGVPIAERRFGAGAFLRPGMIEPFECKGVLIEGVTLRDSAFWVVHPIFCTNVTVRHVTVDSLNPNNDGCDPDSCTDVLIEDCSFHTGDDGIALKAGRDADAWRDGRPLQNVVIRRCRFREDANALCIGSELSGGVRHIFMEDCDVAQGTSCVYFKSNLDRGGFMENVRVRNIRVDLATAAVIRFETHYHGYRDGHAPTAFRDFVIEDVTCRQSTGYGIFADGLAEAPIRDVLLRRVTIARAREPVFLQAIAPLRLDRVRVNGSDLPEHPSLTPADVPPLDVRQ